MLVIFLFFKPDTKGRVFNFPLGWPDLNRIQISQRGPRIANISQVLFYVLDIVLGQLQAHTT